MNMNSNKKNELIDPEFAHLFEFSSEENELQHEARMIMYRFLSEIERLEGQERGLKTKLARAIKKTQSYITQLFNGDKLVNLLTLAKFQKALGIKFKITAYREEEFDKYCALTEPAQVVFNILPPWQEYTVVDSVASKNNVTVHRAKPIEKIALNLS